MSQPSSFTASEIPQWCRDIFPDPEFSEIDINGFKISAGVNKNNLLVIRYSEPVQEMVLGEEQAMRMMYLLTATFKKMI